MKIKIDPENAKSRTALIDALHGVQGRCTARLLSISDLWDAAKDLEGRMDGVLPKKLRKGARAYVTEPFGSVSGRYKGIPEATWATLQRGAADWFLVDVRRKYASERNISATVAVALILTEEQRRVAAEKMLERLQDFS